MATTYGLTSAGFVVKQQSEILSEINDSLQQVFGPNINLNADSVFGQIAGIFSEREALVWQLAEAVYNSQYPTGAEGTSVDNILALNNLTRLPATPTVTNATSLTGSNGITTYGLVLFGTPGTQIPAGSTINTTAVPPLSFSLNSAVTISSPVNAVQKIIFSSIPISGNFTISIQDNNSNIFDSSGNVIVYNGNILTSISLQYNTAANYSQLFFSATPTGGSFTLTLNQCGASLTTSSISTFTSSAIQSAIQALSGYSSVAVTGSVGSGFEILWGNIANPLVTITSSLTGATVSNVDSVQAAINNLYDSISNSNNYPFSDVIVTGSFGTGFIINFGAGNTVGSNLSSGDQPISELNASGTLFTTGSVFTTLNVLNSVIGSKAQAVGAATCTVTGVNPVNAGTLNVIGTPISGWTGVTNQLDCVTGTVVESDTAALNRRSTLLATQANGPLQAIIEKISNNVPGVGSVLGFQNLSEAAIQILTFDSIPSSGYISLVVNGQQTAPILCTTGNPTSGSIQNAIQALSGFGSTLVTGNVASGFNIDFNGSYGGQPIPLILVSGNSTGVNVTFSFGRPGKSIEILAQNGASYVNQIIEQIYESKPAGIQTYGAQIFITGNTTYESAVITSASETTGIVPGMLIFGQGVLYGATVTSVDNSGDSITISDPVQVGVTGASFQFNYGGFVEDAYGNEYQINFSIPTAVPIYIVLSLITDLYKTPGNPSSGLNPSSVFNPATIQTIINDLISIGEAVPIGGKIIGFGTNGLIGAFNSVPGVVDYTLYFGTSESPNSNNYIQLGPEQLAQFETDLITVSYS